MTDKSIRRECQRQARALIDFLAGAVSQLDPVASATYIAAIAVADAALDVLVAVDTETGG